MTSASHDARYWRQVGEVWARSRRDALWRQHCDAINDALLERWLPRAPVATLLKTDLFDEALTARLFPRLRHVARRVVGMDLSLAIAEQAAARCPGLAVVRADARRLPFADGSFDVIVSLSTLDHFHCQADLAESLHQLGRVARPAGRLLLTLDNPTNPLVALRNSLPFGLLHRLGLVPYFVGATVGLRRLERCLDTAGFDITDARTVMHCPRVLAVPVSRLLARTAHQPTQSHWLRLLQAAEGLAALPSRSVTGHFIAVLARKR